VQRNISHTNFCPVVIEITCTAGHFFQSGTRIITGIGSIATELTGIEFRGHVTTAAPAFVTNAPETNSPWSRVTVFSTELAHRADTVEVEVFYPFGHFFYSTATYVCRDVGFSVQEFAEVHEFVGTERVVFGNAAPVGVHHFRAIGSFTDTVTPVVFICKAATRPAEVRDVDLFECINDIEADAVFFRYVQGGVYPETTVNAVAEVLGEVTIDVAADLVI